MELSRHNKIDDVWVAIRGKVYNVTAYIPFHPGGPEELMRAAGIDATRLFDQVNYIVIYCITKNTMLGNVNLISDFISCYSLTK